MISISESVTPEDIFGKSDILPGQDWLNKDKVILYASMMLEDRFPWETAQYFEPLVIEVGTNGKVISQGHHRWAAAYLAGIAMPYNFEMYYDYLNKGQEVSYALRWKDVHWE